MLATLIFGMEFTFKNESQYKNIQKAIQHDLLYYQMDVKNIKLSVSYNHGHYMPNKPFTVTVYLKAEEDISKSIMKQSDTLHSMAQQFEKRVLGYI